MDVAHGYLWLVKLMQKQVWSSQRNYENEIEGVTENRQWQEVLDKQLPENEVKFHVAKTRDL